MNGKKHGGRSERIVYVTIVGLVLAGLSVTGTVIAAGHWRPQNVLPKEINSSFHAFHLLGFHLGAPFLVAFAVKKCTLSSLWMVALVLLNVTVALSVFSERYAFENTAASFLLSGNVVAASVPLFLSSSSRYLAATLLTPVSLFWLIQKKERLDVKIIVAIALFDPILATFTSFPVFTGAILSVISLPLVREHHAFSRYFWLPVATLSSLLVLISPHASALLSAVAFLAQVALTLVVARSAWKAPRCLQERIRRRILTVFFLESSVLTMFLSGLASDIHLHDTLLYTGSVHFRALTLLFAVILNMRWGSKLAVQWAVIFSGVSAAHIFVFAHSWVGLSGMPRRYYNTLPEFEPLLRVAAIGAVLLCVSILVWVYFNAAEALRRPR